MISNFTKRLKEGMELNGLRQADLAQKTGLSKSRISHYMSGRYEAKQEALYLIAKALNVNEAWLMGHDVPKERTVTEKETDLSKETNVINQVYIHLGAQSGEMLVDFLRLSDEGREKVLSYMTDLLNVSKYRKDEE